MTEAQTVSSEVHVAVDPATAFKAFTEEMDLWWLRGPINFWGDAGRVVELRCEPGVGGRILEVLDDPASGPVLELARITRWEPGARLDWMSSLDDVETEVSFVPVEGGTRVTVKHLVPPGGRDKGGSSWSRVVPNWFGAWCAKRDRVPHVQIDVAQLSLGIYYARPAAAARWLAEAFGFEPVTDLPPDDDGDPWIEFRLGNSILNIFRLDGERTGDLRTHVPWVYVEDLAMHFARAKASEATIVEEIHSYPGSSVYVADDLEGNRWTFSQARPTMR